MLAPEYDAPMYVYGYISHTCVILLYISQNKIKLIMKLHKLRL